jgi:pyrroline-5-carboxylate reductase
MEFREIAFIGAGNMTRSIIAGMLSSDYPKQQITATAPSESTRTAISTEFGINTSSNNVVAAKSADVIVLAVKPQMMEVVAAELKALDLSSKLIISIAAGITCERLEAMFEQSLQLVRVMPNTPALIREGMSGLYAPSSVSESDKTFSDQLMSAVGKVCWVDTEAGINNIIAAAGSAPAYFFLFMEAMQQEAIAQGFDENTARMLVQQTALGAAEMVVANPDLELSTLREQVTSKGGTTAQALATFNQHNLSDIVAKAMQAAVTRAEEMESQI